MTSITGLPILKTKSSVIEDTFAFLSHRLLSARIQSHFTQLFGIQIIPIQIIGKKHRDDHFLIPYDKITGAIPFQGYSFPDTIQKVQIVIQSHLIGISFELFDQFGVIDHADLMSTRMADNEIPRSTLHSPHAGGSPFGFIQQNSPLEFE